jgi:hypothetical protein
MMELALWILTSDVRHEREVISTPEGPQLYKTKVMWAARRK